jgi:hypothetical protein
MLTSFLFRKRRENTESTQLPPSASSGMNAQQPVSIQPKRHSIPNDASKSERAVTSTTTLERLCAQELFANFFFALTAYFRKLHKASRARLEFEGSSGDELRWSNPVITKLAQAVESSGLATFEESYMLVVPPFYARDLLPASYGRKSHRKYDLTGSSYYYSDYTSSSEPTSNDR